jgi:hypothetical protein
MTYALLTPTEVSMKTRKLADIRHKLKGLPAEEAARLDAETPPFVPETNPRRKCLVMDLPKPKTDGKKD